jgi:hypothetical protein
MNTNKGKLPSVFTIWMTSARGDFRDTDISIRILVRTYCPKHKVGAICTRHWDLVKIFSTLLSLVGLLMDARSINY